MAIDRSAGTEIIRTAFFENVPGTGARDLIIGVQYHIYTVLSIVIYAESINSTADTVQIRLLGYDSYGGTSAQDIRLMKRSVQAFETFVWNDKFSFNGFEPVNFTGPMDDATKQDAIADQGSSVAQKLKFVASNASSTYHITVTFIDQNNA